MRVRVRVRVRVRGSGPYLAVLEHRGDRQHVASSPLGDGPGEHVDETRDEPVDEEDHYEHLALAW